MYNGLEPKVYIFPCICFGPSAWHVPFQKRPPNVFHVTRVLRPIYLFYLNKHMLIYTCGFTLDLIPLHSRPLYALKTKVPGASLYNHVFPGHAFVFLSNYIYVKIISKLNNNKYNHQTNPPTTFKRRSNNYEGQ